MSENRIKILSKLMEEEQIKKLAQETATQGEVDPATADRLAQEVFDKLFDEELKKIVS